MPNLNTNNNIHSNSFYVRKLIYGFIESTAGLLLTGLSFSTALCLYDNTKNSNLLNDNLDTFFNFNNLMTSAIAAMELHVALDWTVSGRIKISLACEGLQNNILSSRQTTESTPLLTNDIETINYYYQQEIPSSNMAVINMPTI